MLILRKYSQKTSIVIGNAIVHIRRSKMKKKIINGIGCLIAKWILHNCDDGLVVKRKGGAKQIIKVFSVQAYRNIIKPAIHRK